MSQICKQCKHASRILKKRNKQRPKIDPMNKGEMNKVSCSVQFFNSLPDVQFHSPTFSQQKIHFSHLFPIENPLLPVIHFNTIMKVSIRIERDGEI